MLALESIERRVGPRTPMLDGCQYYETGWRASPLGSHTKSLLYHLSAAPQVFHVPDPSASWNVAFETTLPEDPSERKVRAR